MQFADPGREMRPPAGGQGFRNASFLHVENNLD